MMFTCNTFYLPFDVDVDEVIPGLWDHEVVDRGLVLPLLSRHEHTKSLVHMLGQEGSERGHHPIKAAKVWSGYTPFRFQFHLLKRGRKADL